MNLYNGHVKCIRYINQNIFKLNYFLLKQHHFLGDTVSTKCLILIAAVHFVLVYKKVLLKVSFVEAGFVEVGFVEVGFVEVWFC